jgi:multisubunit Na+/H+ antiporter MnhC subunit
VRAVEAFISGALVLIGLYLLFNAKNVQGVISELAKGGARLIVALQGRPGSEA